MNPELVGAAKQHLEDLLSFFEVNAGVSAEADGDTIKLSVDSDGGGRLIGHRGETLQALQYVLNSIIRRQTQERVYVHVDIGGYREARLGKLEEQAKEAADKVRESGEEVSLGRMTSAERRHVHSFVGELEGVVSESRGEGNRRRLIVLPE